MALKITLPISKRPTKPKDFKFMAECIREKNLSFDRDYGGERISFNAAGFIVSCPDTRLAVERLAAKIQKANLFRPKKTANPQISYSKRNIIKRAADDPELLSELLYLFDTDEDTII